MIWKQKNDLINNAHQIISNEKIKRFAEEVAGNFWKKYVLEKLTFFLYILKQMIVGSSYLNSLFKGALIE